MTSLSVNVNKIATLRNARGGNLPNLIEVAKDCMKFGADGITVHPRPDERHIRYKDVVELRSVSQEFNIEGYPTDNFLDLVLKVLPTQCTLVPDPPNALTSNEGWNIKQNETLLKEVLKKFKNYNIRTSIFVEAETEVIKLASEIGIDRIELYTGPYAENPDNIELLNQYSETANLAHTLGLGVNAGHDLNLNNLAKLIKNIPHIKEVSIGHALICDALYFGLEETIKKYKQELLYPTYEEKLL